jgi:excisionase family DNA binding protein
MKAEINAMNEQLYRVPEVAHVPGLSRGKAYDLAAPGIIPTIRVGGSIRVPFDALKARIAKQMEERGRDVTRRVTAFALR